MRTCSIIAFILTSGLALGTAWMDFSGMVSFALALLAGACLIFALWPKKIPVEIVLELGGVQWTEEDFCRGWEIDGRTGSGKTASGVVPIIYQLKRNRPDVGILALDTKGDLSEPLTRIAEDLKCQDSLVQLEVRPENAAPDWQPNLRG